MQKNQIKFPTLVEVDREISRRSLAGFAKSAWHVLEPATPLKWGWSLDAVCEHLEAVTNGDIKRLVINIPPGCLKSMLVGVFWPMWEWGPQKKPEMRFLSTAFNERLAIRDSVKARRLLTSEWYQARWPIQIVKDQNAKTKFENVHTGFREAMPFASMTGSRGDRVTIDDPVKVDDGNSEANLLAAELSFTESLPTRVNNDSSAIIVIMQRIHARDTTGIILERELDYTHLMLPMRFEEDRRCSTRIGFVDPRVNDGELLFPERFSEKQLDETEKTMGSYAIAGQMQQRPVPRDGGLFKRGWFDIVEAIPRNTVFVRGWDQAGTENGGDYTAGVKIGRMPDGRFIIAHVLRDQLSPLGVKSVIKNIAKTDGYGCRISIAQDPGSAGKAVAQIQVMDLAGFIVEATPETGSKVTRAEPLAAQAEAGNVVVLSGSWNNDFLDEICDFPNGKYDDQVDAASRSFNSLVTIDNFDIGVMS